MIEFMEPDTI